MQWRATKITRNFFGTLESLYCFIRQSTCWHSLFQTLQHEFEAATDHDSGRLAIKQLCETRWACRFEATRQWRQTCKNFFILLRMKQLKQKLQLMPEAYCINFKALSFSWLWLCWNSSLSIQMLSANTCNQSRLILEWLSNQNRQHLV